MKIFLKRLVKGFNKYQLGIILGSLTIGIGIKIVLQNKLNYQDSNLYLGAILISIGYIIIKKSPPNNIYQRDIHDKSK